MNKYLFVFLFGILIFLTIHQKYIFKHSSEIKSSYLYTELQHSHMENGKYKRIGILWMDRKTVKPLNGLVYDYARDGSRIEFGFLKNGYQDGVWNFFHENGQASMENIYINGEFIETTKRWDVNGALIEQSYDANITN